MIEAQGGVIPCIENGFFQREIADAAYKYQVELDKKEKIVVGINDFVEENEKIVSQKGMDSIGLLMGRCMSILRGRVDGEKVNKKLVTRLTQHLHKS